MPSTNWTDQVDIAITVADEHGTITGMNPTSIATFAKDGGAKLIGTDLFASHPEPSRTQLEGMYRDHKPNHYTIEKSGQKKIIHQLPLFDGPEFRGYVEISIPIPDHLPHFKRI